VFEALLEAAAQFNDYRLPELFGGNVRTPYESPVPYPVACAPRAWAAGTIPYLLKWGLGLSPDGLNRRLRIIRPSSPHCSAGWRCRGCAWRGPRSTSASSERAST
jgi:glycogen debranching enzyme